MANDEEVFSVARREPEPTPAKRASGTRTGLLAGLLYGGAGFALGGPIGLLAGLGAGIAAKRGQDSLLDREARTIAQTRGEFASLNDEIKSEIERADPDEVRLLESAKRTANDGYRRLLAGDPSGGQMLEQANTIIRSVISGDVTARKTEEAARFNDRRQLVGQAARGYREEYAATITRAREIDALSARVFELTADPKFDPAKPVNRAVLSQLITTGVGDTFRDDPSGFLEGLSQAGQGTFLGGLAGGLDTYLDAEDFQISREDFNRLALNSRRIVSQYAEQRLQEIKKGGESLNQVSRSSGLTTDDYDLAEYISGGIDELKIAPPATAPTSLPTQRSAESLTQSPSLRPGSKAEARAQLEQAKQRQAARRRRPTN